MLWPCCLTNLRIVSTQHSSQILTSCELDWSLQWGTLLVCNDLQTSVNAWKQIAFPFTHGTSWSRAEPLVVSCNGAFALQNKLNKDLSKFIPCFYASSWRIDVWQHSLTFANKMDYWVSMMPFINNLSFKNTLFQSLCYENKMSVCWNET